MIDELIADAKERMEGVVSATKREFGTIRTGRANPGLLERVEVSYYGTQTPLKQLATISAPDPRMLLVQPWDKGIVADVEKAILQADLGLTPTVDGPLIRVPIPQLTEERRKELVRIARKTAEEMRVQVRNVRRDVNDDLRALEKEGDSSEDETRRALAEVQSLTDRYIEEIGRLLEAKERDVTEV